jgi:PAS domain S-box-containing protein
MWIFDEATLRFLAVNRAAVKLYGYSRNEFLDLTIKAIRPRQEVPKLWAMPARQKASAAASVSVLRHRKKDGTVFDVEVTISRIEFHGRQARLTIVNDITGRQRASKEKRVEQRTAQLRALNQALQEEMGCRRQLENEILGVIEREQRRIGRDLHDGLCQMTMATAMISEGLARDLADRALPREARTSRRITELIQATGDEARRLSRGLSPVSLEADGLAIALEDLAISTRKLFHVRCRFRCAAAVPIADHTTAVHLFRIAQEAVSNAVRHAKPRHIEIGLRRDHARLILSIADDGRGLPQRPPTRHGMGLHVMRYRADIIGGVIRFERGPKRGTIVTCLVSPRVLKREKTPSAAAS